MTFATDRTDRCTRVLTLRFPAVLPRRAAHGAALGALGLMLAFLQDSLLDRAVLPLGRIEELPDLQTQATAAAAADPTRGSAPYMIINGSAMENLEVLENQYGGTAGRVRVGVRVRVDYLTLTWRCWRIRTAGRQVPWGGGARVLLTLGWQTHTTSGRELPYCRCLNVLSIGGFQYRKANPIDCNAPSYQPRISHFNVTSILASTLNS